MVVDFCMRIQVIIGTSAGKHPQGDPHDDNTAPDPTNITADVSRAKDAADGQEVNPKHDRTKKPVSNIVWTNMGPIMHMISEVVDTWERFGNALSPTPPFPVERPRMTLAACLLPPLLLSFFVSSYMLLKGTAFGVGFLFFGDPIITPALQFVSRTYPRWKNSLSCGIRFYEAYQPMLSLQLPYCALARGTRCQFLRHRLPTCRLRSRLTQKLQNRSTL